MPDRHPNQHLIEAEASRLLDLPRHVARAQFGDRVARAFLETGDHVRQVELDFNARLATALRERARLRRTPSLWGDES